MSLATRASALRSLSAGVGRPFRLNKSIPPPKSPSLRAVNRLGCAVARQLDPTVAVRHAGQPERREGEP